MSAEVTTVHTVDEWFDTLNTCVYDSALLSPPSDSIMAKPIDPREPQLTGLYGWAANRLGVPPWGQILIFVLVLIIVSTFFWYQSVERHLSNIDTSIQVLPLQIGRDLLSQANADLTLGRSKKALTATEAATALFAQASIKRIPAKPDFFSGTVADLNILENHATSPDFSGKIISARQILAGYRSSLEPVPTPQKKEKTIEESYEITHASSTMNPDNTGGTTLIFPPGVEAFQNPFFRRLSDNNHVENLTIKGGIQTLDGFHWKDVVFIDTLIKYGDGETELLSVRFVNCTFQVPDSHRGARVADYAALGLSSLRLPPSS